MTVDIQALRELLQAATPGPWSARFEHPSKFSGGNEWHIDGAEPHGCMSCGLSDDTPQAATNAALICAAVNALPELLAIAEAALAWRAEHPYDCRPSMDALCAAVDAARKP